MFGNGRSLLAYEKTAFDGHISMPRMRKFFSRFGSATLKNVGARTVLQDACVITKKAEA
jgi:hypothetical protein